MKIEQFIFNVCFNHDIAGYTHIKNADNLIARVPPPLYFKAIHSIFISEKIK